MQAGDDAMVWWYNGDSYATNYARLHAIVEVTEADYTQSLLYAAVGWYEVQTYQGQMTGCAQVSWRVKQSSVDFVPVSLVRGQMMVAHVCTSDCVVAQRCPSHIVAPDESESAKSGRSPRPVADRECAACVACTSAHPQIFHCHPPRHVIRNKKLTENSKAWTANLFNVFSEADGFTAGRQRA